MGANSKIEWTDATWNPVTGCTRVSEGCRHCYAERMAKRLAGRCGYPADDPFRVTMHPDRLGEPLRWRKSRMVFVCSMGDLFHEDVPDWFTERVFCVMAFAQNHTFQVLTKRPDRMAEWFTDWDGFNECDVIDGVLMGHSGDHFANSNIRPWPLPNVWLGTSVEDQATADERIPHLLECPAAVRFVSAEPLLGPVDLLPWLVLEDSGYTSDGYKSALDWIICGGESGPNARPMNPDWARSLRDQCEAAGVSFFFKQWGEWREYDPQSPLGLRTPSGAFCADGLFYQYQATIPSTPVIEMARVGKRAAGRLLDGRTHDGMPEVGHA